MGRPAKQVARPAAAPAAIVVAKLPPYRLVRIDDLEEYPNNARQHSPAQVEMLAKLITEFGWTNPVLIDGERGIIAGHGRVLAARKLGLDVVPTIQLRHLSDAQKRAYIIADNASALSASWDNDLLSAELAELGYMGFDLSLTGFDEAQIGALLGPADGLTDPDDAPPTPAVTCPSCGHVFTAAERAKAAA